MFECVCPRDYFGDLCQTNTGFCSTNPCISGSCHVCCKLVQSTHCDVDFPYIQDLDDGYRCNCNIGYTGVNCSDEINECDSKPCGDNGDCMVSYIYSHLYGLVFHIHIIHFNHNNIGWSR